MEATSNSNTSLDVSWTVPENPGPRITDYDYQYKETSSSSWTVVDDTTITRTSVTIPSLDPETSYDVQVRARNADGMSDWSDTGPGSTSEPVANRPPVFSDGTSTTRAVSETAQASSPVGAPVTATDADNDTLVYSLDGTDASSFDITSSGGQLLVGAGTVLDASTKSTYSVTVVANDGIVTATIDVTITVTAVLDEPPSVPDAPTVTANADSATSLDVSWVAPANQGPPITDYDYRYAVASNSLFKFWTMVDDTPITDTMDTIENLTTGTTYEVQIRATNASGTTGWSDSGTGTPEDTSANNPPAFSSVTTSRSVVENTEAGNNIGSPVTATDDDPDDTLTYTLSGLDASSFNIDDVTGQLMTRVPLDYEVKRSYSVTVTATDRSGAADSIEVTINVIQVAVHDCAGGGAVADAANNPGLVSDCDALLSARNTLEGRARLDWSESTRIEQWEGVSISGTPMRVTGLNLMDRGLSGTIPASLSRLSELTRLNLRSNPGLSGEIPDALGNLDNLRLLNLHSNSHTGAIPDLRRIAGLEELYLANNADYNADGSKVRNSGLTGRIPTWLNGMTNMEELWLWGNSLTDTIPNLSGMTSLQKLKLAGNDLTGGVPAGDMLPPNVTWLIIDSNPFGGPIPDLSSLSRLRLLWLHNNGLTGEIPAGTMFPASVDDLNLRDNMLTGAIPDLSSLDMATRVRLHGNMLTGEVPASLGRLDSLKQLWLWENKLTSINAGLGDLSDTLIEIGLEGNPWNANACVPESLANVTTNDYTAAGIDVCDGS